ncbi:MAG: Tab2/Atab2 family RNA-binding protein [Cyanobacteria bacterium P01_G01_bin.54]
MGKTIWELDFYSRPIFDENKKKVWELLICESPLTVVRSPDSLFRFSKFTNSQTVNSIWLKAALEEALAAAPTPPQRIRFFRRAMNNMIIKACEDASLVAVPSRRTYTLNHWLAERLETVYPQQAGYDAAAASNASVQYPALNPIALPDAVRGDKRDRWALVNLEARSLQEMVDWEVAFGEGFPLELTAVQPETPIPGLLIFSPRALPLSGWMAGLELGYLHLEEKPLPRLCLETGSSDSWILADLKSKGMVAEAQQFEVAKQASDGVHFLALQTRQENEAFAGFWLLQG